MVVVSQRNAQDALLPGKTRYPLYMRLGGPQGRSGRVWKISLPAGFDPRTVQPVASRYTDWATIGQINSANSKQNVNDLLQRYSKHSSILLQFQWSGSARPYRQQN